MMRKMVLMLGACAAMLSVGGSVLATNAADTKAPIAAVSSIRWEKTFEKAKARAQKENKPIVLLQMFGRLDEEFC